MIGLRHNAWAFVVLIGVVWSCRATGQETSQRARSVADTAALPQADAGALKRTISLALRDVTLEAALNTIAKKGQVRFAYSPADVPLEVHVSLVVESVTVGEALTLLLRGTGVGVTGVRDEWLVLGKNADGSTTLAGRGHQDAPEQGGISGSVTDSATRTTISRVEVRVQETGQVAVSDGEGNYLIKPIAAGVYHLSTRRVGFIVRTREVVVHDGQVAVLNFILSQPPTKLDEVVTTAVGDQRRYQVGNDISTLNVDSIAPTAAITSVTDVLTGRVPGLQLLETGGLTGSGQAIRIEGQSSLSLQSDPIIIVDGVRQDNSPGGSYNSTLGFSVTASPNRLDDIDPSQIATIDVLKGPAAATEYGTDAANGVIVITTKHGTTGKPQWHLSAEDGLSTIPTGFPDYYYSWGHTTDGAATPVQCPITSAATGSCAVDSVTHFNPLNTSRTSFYGTGSRSKYALDVGGGTDAIRYFVAGGLSNETSPLQLPPVFVPQAEAYGFPNSVLRSNGEQQRSGRANLFFKAGSTADISVNTAYMSTYETIPVLAELTQGAAAGGPPDSANNYGYGPGKAFSPITSLGRLSTQQTNRFTGGLSGNWRPTAWFTAYGDAGLDHGNQTSQQTILPQVEVYRGGDPNSGDYGLSQTVTDIYSADVRATATATLAQSLRAVSTVGANLRDTRVSGVSAEAFELSATNLTLAGAPYVQVGQQGNRSATLGGYGEEQLQIADQLFLTGAVRIDGSSGFGYQYQTATYPKGSISWLAVPRGPATVRLRAAYGVSGVAPYNGMALQLYAPVAVTTSSGGVNGVVINQPGNPDLKPERTGEWEGGVDIGILGNRVSLALTGYTKTTQDALYSETLGWDVNDYPYEVNIGEIRNSGLEGQITAIPIASRAVTWSVTLNASVNHNLLVHLAPGLSPLLMGPSNDQRQVPGYPLYGFWGYQDHYSTPANGVLLPNQITQDTAASYMGSSIPTQNASFETHVTALHGALTVGALFTYQGGYKVFNTLAEDAAENNSLPAQNIIGSPLWQQARAVAYNEFGNDPAGFFEDGTILRFQELSLTYSLPAHWARVIHFHSLSVTGAIRNLAFWTRYTGGDPSASDPGGGVTATAYGAVVNNDIRFSGSNSVPLARYFQFRLNAGF
jgi:TonB-linked SusC/RagA family outer membrane protein